MVGWRSGQRGARGSRSGGAPSARRPAGSRDRRKRSRLPRLHRFRGRWYHVGGRRGNPRVVIPDSDGPLPVDDGIRSAGLVTRLLQEADAGDAEARRRLWSTVYEELRAIAHARSAPGTARFRQRPWSTRPICACAAGPTATGSRPTAGVFSPPPPRRCAASAWMTSVRSASSSASRSSGASPFVGVAIKSPSATRTRPTPRLARAGRRRTGKT